MNFFSVLGLFLLMATFTLQANDLGVDLVLLDNQDCDTVMSLGLCAHNSLNQIGIYNPDKFDLAKIQQKVMDEFNEDGSEREYTTSKTVAVQWFKEVVESRGMWENFDTKLCIDDNGLSYSVYDFIKMIKSDDTRGVLVTRPKKSHVNESTAFIKFYLFRNESKGNAAFLVEFNYTD